MAPVSEPLTSSRLALFLPALAGGGAERVMLDLAASFRARGRDVDLVVAVPGGPLAPGGGVRVVDLGASRTMAALPALVGYLRRARPAALLSTLEHANLLALWAARLARTGARVVVREARVALPAPELRGWKQRSERALMRRFYATASRVVAVSRSVEESLAREVGVPADRLVTIYNPVITPALAAMADADLDDPWFAPGEPPVVLGVGRLDPQKDFATLLRAFARLRALRPARLVILGEGAERTALAALARELGISAEVRMPGFDPNPFRYMRRAAVFALSSVLEGLPGVLIQAMACGCRVISTDCPGGSREILEAGKLGPLVPPGDPEALAGGLVTLLHDVDRGPPRLSYPLDRFAETAAVDRYLAILDGS